VNTPTIPALRRLRQEDYKFEVSLDYTEGSCQKKKYIKISSPFTQDPAFS
jgi:hypothetical protein